MGSDLARDRLPLLEVDGLETIVPSHRGWVRPVAGIDLKVGSGEVLGLVGESGSGKTMTALSLMRLVPAPGRTVRGHARLKGTDLLALSEREMRRIRGNRIGMIFQDPMTSLNPVVSVGDHIEEGLRIHKGLGRRSARRRAIELLEMVGIASSGVTDRYPHQLSGGMRQRVMIAAALSCEPELLIADEPTTALDVTIQAQILEILTQLKHERAMSMILISHDLGVVAGIADTVNVMYAGRIVESGSVYDVLENPRHPYAEGLLESIPSLDRPLSDRLVAIPGLPPDLAEMAPGCPFAPRCKYRIQLCAERPDLMPVSPAGLGSDHHAACWVRVSGDEYPSAGD
jgi:oligopeptide transport system ATP-binding protein